MSATSATWNVWCTRCDRLLSQVAEPVADAIAAEHVDVCPEGGLTVVIDGDFDGFSDGE